MSRLEHLAETIKLSRLLGVPEGRLALLSELDHTTLRAMRERLGDTFLDDTRPLLQRAVKASRLLPIALIAKVGQRVFGPVLCAHMASLMEPTRAVEIALRMPDEFLADVSAILEPRRAEALIRAIPAARVVAAARILAARGDHVTLARFVGFLPDATIRAVIEAVPSDEALLRTAFFLESKSALDRLVGLVPPDRLRGVVALVASAGAELWTEALSLMTHVGERWQGHIGDLTAAQGEAALGQMLDTTHRLELWPQVIPLIAAMSEPSQRRLLALDAVRTPGVVRAIVRAADRVAAWPRLMPIVLHMEEDLRRHVAAEIEALGPGVFERILPLRSMLEAAPTRVLPALAAIALHLSDAMRAELEATLRAHPV